MSERKAGRELDAEIAEKVMGWTLTTPVDPSCDYRVGVNRMGESVRCNFGRAPGTPSDSHLPPYSTDIAAAWQVVEKMRERGWAMGMDAEIMPGGGAHYTIAFYPSDGHGGADALRSADGEADTAPLAICLAALAATPDTNGSAE